MAKEIMIHPLSDVQTSSIGEGTTIWQFCVILQGARIGKNVNVNCQVFIENDVLIGDNVTIKPGVQIWDGITLENNVFIGPNVTFTNDISPRSRSYPERFMRTTIKEGASIGANATLLPGIQVGKFALIGAGTVVTKDVGDHELIVGNPGRKVGFVTKSGIRLNNDLIDSEGNQFKMTENGPIIVDP
ncbi:MAG: N-acetyltransferase [Bacteroidota bacterium]|nr:N-acetyltransferase [Bacteroidota bacterium]